MWRLMFHSSTSFLILSSIQGHTFGFEAQLFDDNGVLSQQVMC
jgi:hypothetical protein